MTPVVNPISNEKKWRLANYKISGISDVSTRILVEHNIRQDIEDLIRWHCMMTIWNKMWDVNR